jgi:hypothetical protein
VFRYRSGTICSSGTVVITQVVVAEVEGGQMAGNPLAVDIGDNIRCGEMLRDPGLFSFYHDPDR